MHLAVLQIGVNADGVIGGIGELKVHIAAPIDGGVHTQRHIVHGVHMLQPLDNIQIGQQGRMVNGGSHLTDAAAYLRRGRAIDESDGRLIALGRRPFTDNVVEGEYVAGVQNGAVDGLAGQIQIGGTARIVGVRRVGRAQHIMEQGLFQLGTGDLRLHRRQGDGQIRPLLGHVLLLLGRSQVEAVALHLIDNFLFVLVVVGVGHVGAHLFIEGIQVHLGIAGFLVVVLQGGEIVVHIGGHDCVIEAVGVQASLAGAHMDNNLRGDGLRDGLTFCAALCGLRHLGLHHFIGGILPLRLDFSGGGVDGGTDILLINAQGAAHVHRVQNLGGGGEGLFQRLENTAIAAVVPGSFHGFVHVHAGLGVGRSKGQGAVRQRHRQRLRAIGGIDSLLDGSLGLFAAHAAHIHTGHTDAGQNITAAVDHQGIAQTAQNHQGRQRCHRDGSNFSLVAALLFCGLGRRSSFVRLSGFGCLGCFGHFGRMLLGSRGFRLGRLLIPRFFKFSHGRLLNTQCNRHCRFLSYYIP